MALQLTTTVQESSDGSFNPDFPSGDKPSGGVTLLYSDDFESYTTGTDADGSNADFALGVQREVVTAQAASPTKSIWFDYTGDGGIYAKQQNFSMTDLHTEITMEFKVYFPSDFEMTANQNGGNNKMFRLWPNTYDVPQKCGCSFIYQTSNTCKIRFERTAQNATNGAVGSALELDDFITVADLGQWTTIKAEVKAGTTSTQGFLKIYKNDVYFGEIFLWNRATDDPGYNFGYLLGSNNTGFDHSTGLYVDDFEVYSGVS